MAMFFSTKEEAIEFAEQYNHRMRRRGDQRLYVWRDPDAKNLAYGVHMLAYKDVTQRVISEWEPGGSVKGKRFDNPGVRDLGAYASYFALDRYLGKHDQRTLAHNTVAVRLEAMQGEGKAIAVILHHTKIVTFDLDGNVTLNSGGYHTTTTKQRMNQFLRPHGWGIFQKNYDWFVYGHGPHAGQQMDFEDGMTLSLGSTVHPSNLGYQGPMRENPEGALRDDKRRKAPMRYNFRRLSLADVLSPDFGRDQLYIEDQQGFMARVRRNGKVKTWKRDPTRVEIPVKFGMYEAFRVTDPSELLVMDADARDNPRERIGADDREYDLRSAGPGKFDKIIDEYVYRIVGEVGTDEEDGSVEENGVWYGLLRNGVGDASDEDHIAREMGLTSDEREYLRNIAGLIVTEDHQGFVYVDYHDDAHSLSRAWQKAQARVGEYYDAREQEDQA